MTKIDEFTKGGARFLKADEVQENFGVHFKITQEATIEKSEKYQTDRLHIPGTFKGEDKIFGCSQTNAKIIQKVLGDDTLTWIGAELTFETYKTKTREGTLVSALMVKQVIPKL